MISLAHFSTGMPLRVALSSFCSAVPLAVKAFLATLVCIKPGQMIDTSILSFSSSIRKASKKPCNACFAPQYPEREGDENLPIKLVMVT